MVKYIDLVSDTICSQITAPGHSGVAVIRVSGSDSFSFVSQQCPSLPARPESHRAYLTPFIDANSGDPVDSVLVTHFEQGRSFTGDAVVEVACHGNPLIVQNILNQLYGQGCRAAERGEFTFRSFYNGKMDLVQAESIQQLVQSSNVHASQNALTSLSGEVSHQFAEMESRLLMILGQLEASIDFSEQDIDPESYKDCIDRCLDLKRLIDPLVDSYDIGKNISGRWNIVLAGETNVGKSSLFNRLFEKDIAIVSDVQGTTRDPNSMDMFLQNHSIQFTDLAGFRENPDALETLGIAKSGEHLEKASFVLWVFDATKPLNSRWLDSYKTSEVLFVANKVDLLSAHEKQAFQETWIKKFGEIPCFMVSAKENSGVSDLKDGIDQVVSAKNNLDDSIVISQVRHYKHLCETLKYVDQGLKLLDTNSSPDLVSQEFQWALMEIHQLLGKTYNDEILDTIFKEFCLGK